MNAAIHERIQAELKKTPGKMTMQLARELGVPEATVIRAMPEGQSYELDAARWQEIIRTFEPLGKVHVISTNASVTMEAFGGFGNFSQTGPFFNVQTASLDMHIRHEQLAAIFAVQKPSHMDGVNTLSIQFYDPAGNSAFKVFLSFGAKAPTPDRQIYFDNLRKNFARRH